MRTDDDSSRQLVDAAILADWQGWDASPDGHVLGPVDVVRRVDGHDVLLPLCTERVDTLLARRGVELALTPGEIVTVTVSALRGMAEITARDRGPATGSWWLTDEGRPVFVDDADGPAAAATTTDLLDRLAADATKPLADAVQHAIALVAEPRALAHELDGAEERLFDVAAAEALGTAPLAAQRRQRPASDPDATTAVDVPRAWWTTVLASVDADFADAFSRATTGLWRRMRRPARRSRRRPWALAACLGAGVIAVGLMWPAPGPPAVAGGQPGVTDVPDRSVAPAATPAADPPDPAAPGESAPAAGAASVDLAVVTATLLDRRRECLAASDDACLSQVAEDPARTFSPGASDIAAGERTVTLLDEFGGVAVLRVEATTGAAPAQLVVIVGGTGSWLLRDVHDVEQQK